MLQFFQRVAANILQTLKVKFQFGKKRVSEPVNNSYAGVIAGMKMGRKQ